MTAIDDRHLPVGTPKCAVDLLLGEVRADFSLKRPSTALTQLIQIALTEDETGLAQEIYSIAQDASSQTRQAYLPELAILFKHHRLTIKTAREWLAIIANQENLIGVNDQSITNVVKLLGDIGTIGFSFPLWRHMAVPLGPANKEIPATTLFESVHAIRLRRSTDKFAQEQLSAGTLDNLGAGYYFAPSTFSDGLVKPTYLEYRRAYIAIGTPDLGLLLVRNSSHFFGRDRLKEPSYYSQTLGGEREVKKLEIHQIENFMSITGENIRLLLDHANSEQLDKLHRLARLFLSVDKVVTDQIFTEHLRPALMQLGARSKASIWLAAIEPAMPPWYPLEVIALDSAPESIETFISSNQVQQRRLVLMSGQNGDLPFVPTSSNLNPGT